MFNDPNMKFSLEVPTILKVEEYPQKIQNVSYAKSFLLSKMSVELADVVNAKDAEEKKQKNINLYLGAFKSQFGDGNVVFNEKKIINLRSCHTKWQLPILMKVKLKFTVAENNK